MPRRPLVVAASQQRQCFAFLAAKQGASMGFLFSVAAAHRFIGSHAGVVLV